MLRQQISPKLWFANVNMTLYVDATNRVYPPTVTTITPLLNTKIW